MSHNLTEVSTFTANVTVPDTGDARTAASVNSAFQSLANRAKYLKEASDASLVAAAIDRGNLKGLIIGPRNASSVGGADIVVESFYGLNIGSTHYGEQAATTVTPGVTSNSTWHYLYAKDDGAGGIAYERSTTAPSASQSYKPGDATRLYICSYYVNGSGNIEPFRKVGNKYLWRRSATAASFSVGVTNTSYANKDLSAFMSPISRIAGIIMKVSNTGAGSFTSMGIRTNGDTTNDFSILGPSAADDPSYLYKEIETDSSHIVQARVDSASGSPIGSIYVDCYYE